VAQKGTDNYRLKAEGILDEEGIAGPAFTATKETIVLK